MSAGATRQLSELAAGVTAGGPPAAVMDVTGLCLADFLAVATLGARLESSEPVLRTVRALGDDGGPCTVIGRRGTASPEHAALLNGMFAHSLDFDDTNIPACSHPGAPVIPAVLAAAEHAGAAGPDVLSGLVAGHEVCCRVGRAIGGGAYDRGFHPTAIAGTFGAAAGAARVLGLDAATTESALGLAGSMASGSMQYLCNGAWNKRLHAGLAARNGLTAVLLAASGFRGSAAAIEGDAGALINFGTVPDPGALTADLGSAWYLLDTGFKPYPSCRLTHAATDICLDLHSELGMRRADSVTVVISPRADSIVGGDAPHKVRPANVVDAQFSVRFQCAVALLDGQVTWASYGRLDDPAVQALAARIMVAIDPDQGPAAATVCLQTGDGVRLERHRDLPRGESGDPDNRRVVDDKLIQAATAAGWPAETLGRLRDLCQVPRTMPAARAWIPWLVAGGGDRA
ncbi:MmgE/PrpD family protein [Amycolatopsis thermophila]|uniref:2-methylcitrate dehydratase PrpD n=1 Tax=Amycolatopsis thermophila TaxID=206084 RepID=A0ABU0F4H6_9PSEU|nr:MmgE/PrpD family protein [Amycolatopsis thermophila]MDQ0382488.1 2-methylcitrate dehydratase PrpD [Amycolatopsis thermophila]